MTAIAIAIIHASNGHLTPKGGSRLAPKVDSQPPSGTERRNGYSLSRTSRNGHGVILAVSGEIDISNAEAFTDEVHSLIGGSDSPVALDLQGCGFIDSSAIRALLVLAQEQQAQGRQLKLLGVTGEPQRVLKVSGLLDSGLFAGSDEGQKRQAA
jgi:anti-sigma B factor antagonist